MDSPISEVNSFIVKTWTEFDEHGKEVKWHGHITHVPSGERRYLSKLDEVVPFIESFLHKRGIMAFRSRWRLSSWLRKLGL